MRIKSYFASSVQAAIALARQEFGDEVSLVTSHIAPLDARHLGEYEVVFAIEEAAEPEVEIVKPESKPFSAFQEAFLGAVAQKPVAPEGKLDSVRGLFIELGIEAGTVRALMTLVEQAVGATPAPSPFTALVESLDVVPVPVAVPMKAKAVACGMTSAEMAFLDAVGCHR